MSDDPETARQIAALAMGTRPLLVCDVDDVLLEFVRPFMAWLETQGMELKTDSFKLTGNIRARGTGAVAPQEEVSALLAGFFDAQADWQQPAAGALDTLGALDETIDIVLLTAMPHRHYGARLTTLERHGIAYPLITTEMAKGPAVKALRGDPGRRVAFIDDIPHNHVSVAADVPDAGCIHLASHEGLAAVMPPLPDGVRKARDWPHAGDLIAELLGL